MGTATEFRAAFATFREAAFSILGRIVGTATTGWSGVSGRFRSFQYPRSDRGHCNNITLKNYILNTALSVSSVGSWALQLSRHTETATVESAFQYPRSDRGHCNPTAPAPTSVITIFQYPRSDRGHCNQHLCCLRSRHRRLSVSSVGSWALQRIRNGIVRTSSGTFSILGRIVGTATCRLRLPVPPQRLPFSILGRIVGTATPPRRSRGAGGRSFQYPRSDRGHCNNPTVNVPINCPGRFQYPRSDRGHCNRFGPTTQAAPPSPFSILGRIVGTATAIATNSSRSIGSFSILGRIVGTATTSRRPHSPASLRLSVSSVGSWALQLFFLPLSLLQLRLSVSSVGSWALQLKMYAAAAKTTPIFQYPRSDRGHCNFFFCHICLFFNFSFQYPRSDRGHCNYRGRSGVASRSVAFSILGRIVGTATRLRALPQTPQPALSVSSVGSWALQLYLIVSSVYPVPNFQYPRSDRGHCNRSAIPATP